MTAELGALLYTNLPALQVDNRRKSGTCEPTVLCNPVQVKRSDLDPSGMFRQTKRSNGSRWEPALSTAGGLVI